MNEWFKRDEGLASRYSGHVLKRQKVGDLDVLRISPHIDGIPVIGAERVLGFNRNAQKWVYGAIHGKASEVGKLVKRQSAQDFILNADDAISKARDYALHLSATQKTANAEQQYLVTDSGLRPVWRVVDFSELSRGRTCRVIDAQTGQLISSVPLTRHVSGLVYPELSWPQFGVKPSPVTLDAVTATQNANFGIRGSDFQSSNTCFAYRCANNDTHGNCNESQSICVDVDASMTEGVDYFTATSYFTTDSRFVDLNTDWQAKGYVNNTIYMAWKKAPVFATRLKKPLDGVWGSDFSFSNYTGYEQTDSFAELQTYHFLSKHMDFMRNLLGDTQFCLIGTGVNCSTANPTNNRTATPFDYPMRYVVNYQGIQTWPDSNSKYPDFITQLSKGLGTNISNPIVFDQHTDYDNAYFSDSNFQPPVNGSEWRNCSNGQCVSIEDSVFDYFAFGQSSTTADWSLNNCVVFHELVHAFVNNFIPGLPWYVWTSSGISSDPGAMNEGWADYFSTIHCGISDFRKTYNGRPLRNMDNSLTCADAVGEVHSDGLVFNGGLWKVREAIPSTGSLNVSNQRDFDLIVLHALSLGHITDNFASQYNAILSLLAQDRVLNVLVPYATQVFSQRVIKCTRVKTYTESMDTTYYLPSAQTTAANISTSNTQMVFYPSSSDWQVGFTWSQWFISPILGSLSIGYGALPIQFVVSFDCPIFLSTGSNGNAVQAFGICEGKNVSLDWQSATFNQKTATGSFLISFGQRQPKAVYFWLTHNTPAEMVMYSTLMTFYGFNRIWRITVAVYSSACVFLFFTATFVATYAAIKQLLRKWYSADISDNLMTRLPPREAYLYFFLTNLMQSAAVVFATLALLFGKVRVTFTWAMLLFLIASSVVDAIFSLSIRKEALVKLCATSKVKLFNMKSVLPFAWMSAVQERLLIASTLNAIFTASVIPIVICTSTPLAVHIVLFIVFVTSSFARLVYSQIFYVALAACLENYSISTEPIEE